MVNCEHTIQLGKKELRKRGEKISNFNEINTWHTTQYRRCYINYEASMCSLVNYTFADIAYILTYSDLNMYEFVHMHMCSIDKHADLHARPCRRRLNLFGVTIAAIIVGVTRFVVGTSYPFPFCVELYLALLSMRSFYMNLHCMLTFFVFCSTRSLADYFEILN